MYYEFVFEQFVDGFVGFSSFEISDSGNQFLGDVLMISHAYFDGGQDPKFFFGDEMKVLDI